MLTEEQTLEEGDKIAQDLLEKLNIPKTDLICGAYMDWLNKK